MKITVQDLDQLIAIRNTQIEICKDKFVPPTTVIGVYTADGGVDAFYAIAEELNLPIVEEPLDEDFLDDYRVYFEYKGYEVSIYQTDFELMRRKEDAQNKTEKLGE